MHAFKFYSAILLICLSSSFNIQAGQQHDLQEYNNLISQHILKTHEALFTSCTSAQPSSSYSTRPDQILEWKRDKTHGKPIIERFGQHFIIKHGNYTRSFSIKPGDTVVRCWFADCQSVETLVKNTHNKLSTQRYRICHKIDLEQIDAQQLALFVHAKDILQDGHTPVIASNNDYQTYLTLPESLQKVFQVNPELLPEPLPIWPAGKRTLTLTTIASMLLGGYMTIF